MAGSKSNFLENTVLNLLLGATAYSVPTTHYIGLWASSSLTDASDGSATGEVSGGSYARVEVDNNTTTWGAATTTGIKKNAIAFTFATATADWGTVGQVAILDASTAGNILFWADLSVAKTITAGDTAKIDVEDLVITED